jgi:hypothetical protein
VASNENHRNRRPQGFALMYERHGHTRRMARSSEHYAWTNMVQRCTNPNRQDFTSYGGRGISVCDKWRDSFEAFFADMGERPSPQHSIDRFPNNDGNYEPGNVRWATKHQQMQNTRATRLITFNGETMGLNAWAKKLGLNKESLRTRLNNWPLELAMTKPAKNDHRRIGATR